MICEKCVYAKWELTASGRKHPSGRGRCTWEKTVRIPGLLANGLYGMEGPLVTLFGVNICRKPGHEHPPRCDVFQPIETGS